MKRILLALLLVTVLILSVSACNTEKTYTVTFDADGGSAVASQVVQKGDKAIAPTAPTKEGYTFAGWFVGETAYDFEAAVTADVALKAKWTLNTYTVTFDADNGSENTTATVEHGKPVAAPAAPEKAGYTFAGWFVGEAAYDFDTAVTADVALKAKWTLNTYTVTFDTDNGSENTTATVEHGKPVAAPAAPTKAGYTFNGWFVGETAYDFEAAVTADVTVKAAWTVNQYTITFDTDGGSEVAPIEQDFGTAVVAPVAPTKEGYTFKGWDKEIPATMPVEGVTLKAVWEINQYTITFNTDGGSAVDSITLNFGAAVTAPADPTKTGYTFADWDKAIPATMPAEDMTITASWTVNQYTITFDTVGGSEITAITLDFGAAVTAPADPTKTGYTFADWDKAIPATMPAEDMTITASWTVNQYTITFDTVGGSEIAAITLNFGAAVTAPADPTKTGYTFVDWDKAIPATMPAEDMTITASWTVNQYTITFNTNGGNKITAITQDYGTTIVAPADPTKTGHTFDRWDKEIPATMPAENMTITASWTINTYIVTFDADNGSALITVEVKYNELVTAPADPEKTGYNFMGWFVGDTAFNVLRPITQNVDLKAHWDINKFTVIIDSDNDIDYESNKVDYGTVITKPTDPEKVGYTFDGWFVDGAEYDFATPVTKNTTIMAKWTVNQYTITFETAGGSAIDAITLDYGAAITAPTAPTKTGYTFGGWDNEIPETMPAENMTITASWTINKYTITFETVGGSVVDSITLDFGATITAPDDPTKTGYTFKEWDKAIPATMPAENMTITASWTINKYTITFNTDGGNEIAAITQDYGTTITAPDDPTKTGYTFEEWDKAIPATMPAEDMTITASWTVNQYTITFETVGGSTVDSITQDYGTTIKAPDDPTKTGYTFGGWDKEIPATMPAENITITASWTLNTYTVTIDTANGAEATNQTVNHGDVAQMPADPTKRGFKFAGWTLNGEAYDVSTPVTGEITLVAAWELDLPDLTAIAGTWTGEETVLYTTTSYEFVIAADGKITATYSSSYTDIELIINYVLFENNVLTINYSTGTVDSADMVFTLSDGNGVLTTNAATGGNELVLKKNYTVTFDWGNYKNNESEVDPSIKTAVHGDKVSVPTKTWSGYEVKAWYLNGEVFDVANTPITSDMTLVAEWGLKEYTVTYYDQAGEVLKVITVKHGESVPESEVPTTGIITVPGSVFNGFWYGTATSNLIVDVVDKAVEANKKCYPGIINPMTDLDGTWTGANSKDSWTIVINAAENKVTATLNGTEQTLAWFRFQELDGKTQFVIYTTAAKAFTYDSAQGTLSIGSSSSLIVLNKMGQQPFTVTFDSNGGSAVAAQTIVKDATAQKPEDPTKAGFTFAGWILNGEAYDFTTPVTSDITLTAKWEEVTTPDVTYTVTFTNGTTTVSTQEVVAGQCAVAPADPTKSGKIFMGWFDGETKFDATTPINGDFEFVAKWGVKVTFYKQRKDGKDEIAKTLTVEDGTVIPAEEIPAAEVNEGFVFTGVWHKSYTVSAAPVDITAPVTAATNLYPGVIDEDVTVLAGTWTGTTTDGVVYTFTIDVAVDENGKVTGADVTVVVDGTPIEVASIQYNTSSTYTQLAIKYYKEGSSSASTYAVNYYEDGTVKLGSPSLVLTKEGQQQNVTVTFDTDGGSAVPAQTIAKDATAQEPTPAPTKSGFAFVGWTLNGEPYDFTTPVTGDITLVATWELDIPDVPDLTAIAGTWTGDESAGYGATYSYEFKIAANGTIIATYDNGYTTVEMTINYVLFENNELTINYTTSAVEGADMVFTLSDDKCILSTQKGDMGFAFELKKNYTVTFDWGNYKNNESEVDPTIKTVDHGETVTAPTKSWTGYEVKAWYLNGEVFDVANTPITSDITLVAEWGVKMLTLTFYGQGGTTVVKIIEVAYNSTLNDIADQIPTEVPTTDGYKFNGKWYASTTATAPQNMASTSKITADKKYYAGVIAPMNDIEGTWTGTDSKNNAFTMEVDAATQTVTITVVNGETTTEYKVASIYYKDFAGTFKMVIRYTTGTGTSESSLTLTYTAEGTFTASNNLVLKKEA